MAKTFKVRAIAKGFGGIPAGRRRQGEVFRVAADRYGKCPKAKWYVPAAADAPEGRPERQRDAGPQFVRKDGQYVNADQRTSADAFKSADTPDTPDTPDVPDGGHKSQDGHAPQDGGQDDGSDLT